MILKKYSMDEIAANLVDVTTHRPFPKAGDRHEWKTFLDQPFNRSRQEVVCGLAQDIVKQPWPILDATLYMEFARNGNRTRYQGPYFKRRGYLGVLVMAECMEYKGRFLDEIINGLWHIISEPTWCLPAHAWRDEGDCLPSEKRQHVDLFACETAMVVAEALFLLGDELEQVSSSLCRRVKARVLTEIVEPIEMYDDFFWFSGRNNWTPWCAANALGAGLYVIDDQERAQKYLQKLIAIVDRYIERYPDDGGCDEGPVYWNVSPGQLLMFLEILHSYTNGAIDLFSEPKIKDMGEFICRVHINKHWFANFADGSARSKLNRMVLYRYGVRVGSEQMKNLAKLQARDWHAENEVVPAFTETNCGSWLNGALRDLFWFDHKEAVEALKVPGSCWLPDLQVMVARDAGDLVLVAKGGCNAENHNHNDVGQFMIYAHGEPVIIDIGVGVYTRKTFSAERYDLWYIRASGHNVPLVNDCEQVASVDARAENVMFSSDDRQVALKMELKSTYPEKANVQSAVRSLMLDRISHAVILKDSLSSCQGKITSLVCLYTPIRPSVDEMGMIRLKNGGIDEVIEFDPELLQFSSEEIKLDDDSLRRNWGDCLYKLCFMGQGVTGRLEYQLTFKHNGN